MSAYSQRIRHLTWDAKKLQCRHDTAGMHPEGDPRQEEEERTFPAEGLAQQRKGSVKQICKLFDVSCIALKAKGDQRYG